MKSVTTSQFWKRYYALPEEVQCRADRAYELWQINPQAHGLYFKRVGKLQPIYSVRVGDVNHVNLASTLYLPVSCCSECFIYYNGLAFKGNYSGH